MKHETFSGLAEPRPIKASMGVEDADKTLDALVKNAPETSRILEVSPALAELILQKRNVSNRPMKPGKIREYAEALRSGHWGLTGDTLKFGPDGTLKDGQNRLAAVVRSQVPLTTHAVFGISADLFTRMDIGKNRTPADVFSIAGLQYANHTAAAVRWLLILTSDNPGNRSATFTNEELLNAYRERFDGMALEHSVRLALEVHKAQGAPTGSTAALHYLFALENKSKADAFMKAWAAQPKGPAKSPPKVLQQCLLDLSAATNNRVHETVRNAMVVQAYLRFLKGQGCSKADLQFNPSEDAFPAIPSKRSAKRPQKAASHVSGD